VKVKVKVRVRVRFRIRVRETPIMCKFASSASGKSVG
jgi:hypothetical protein